MLVRAALPDELGWIRGKTGCGLTPSARGIVAVHPSRGIRGMVAYDHWTPNSVQAHMAVESPMVWRHLLEPAFAYPFLEADRELLLGFVCSDNPRSMAMVEALGFRETHRFCDGWSRDVDVVVLEMRRAECPWISRERRAA